MSHERRRAGSACVPMALAIGIALSPPASAAAGPTVTVENGRTQPVFSYADAIREHVYVESPLDGDGDGEKDRVRVDIIRPRESGPRLKVPVIIDESPYYDNSGRGNESERKLYDAAGEVARFPLFYDNYFVPRGYAVLNVDMAGTTRSDGCPDAGGRSDVLGGKAVIDWLNGRARAYRADGTPAAATWTNGDAAMIGKSYDGTLANAVAATGVEGLKTIVPISAISSWYRYQRMNGVVYTYDYMSWLADYVDTDPPAKCAAVRARLDAEDGDTTGDYNAFWKERDYLAGSLAAARNVRAGVFAVHTANDLNVKPDHFATWWRALARYGVPRKLWVGQYHHVDPFDFRRDAWVDTLHRWFDHWLYRVPNGIMREPRADVQTGPDTWITQRDWPAPDAIRVPLRPGPGGTLGLRPARRGAQASFTDIAQPEDVMVADAGTPAPGRLAFVTGELPLDLRLSGTPHVDLRLKLDRPTANLTALLVDYGAGPRVDWRRGQGITTVAEESCHGEAAGPDDGCYRRTVTNTAERPVEVIARGWIDAQNRHSASRPAPLRPGVYADVRWDTLPHDYVFRKGHRLGLVIAGTDRDFSQEAATGATVTLDLSRSEVHVPLVMPGSLTAPDLPERQDDWRGPSYVPLPVPEPRLH
ncbi:Xaa-Pro dipeptidase [Spongiactinospora gelatinilytica]|uniref:Xaa-Pro dipeptidyl-peptidase n=1 Tax=Spongiactinospora gelatinilytica TaxID=2666298 RepID=A0A2W2GAL4_9ACTN|nr:Xaa-Pro dipeptidyl-peptidase [Spongiactinospora gelatinilytica]PZG45431.1 Xaa-Pro dipeptidase [Spongiactinospora gelatinilytica]